MTDPNCKECNGEGYVEYLISVDDTKRMNCELCNDGYDEDADYDRMKDAECEAYFDKMNK